MGSIMMGSLHIHVVAVSSDVCVFVSVCPLCWRGVCPFVGVFGPRVRAVFELVGSGPRLGERLTLRPAKNVVALVS
jgi:hypothetical protein